MWPIGGPFAPVGSLPALGEMKCRVLSTVSVEPSPAFLSGELGAFLAGPARHRAPPLLGGVLGSTPLSGRTALFDGLRHTLSPRGPWPWGADRRGLLVGLSGRGSPVGPWPWAWARRHWSGATGSVPARVSGARGPCGRQERGSRTGLWTAGREGRAREAPGPSPQPGPGGARPPWEVALSSWWRRIQGQRELCPRCTLSVPVRQACSGARLGSLRRHPAPPSGPPAEPGCRFRFPCEGLSPDATQLRGSGGREAVPLARWSAQPAGQGRLGRAVKEGRGPAGVVCGQHL